MKSRIASCIETSRPIVGSSRNSVVGPVQERGGELALHALAERELARRLVDNAREVEQLGRARRASGRTRHDRDIEDRAVERVGLRRRQVPDELLLLPHDQRDRLEERGLALNGMCPSTSTSPLVGWSRPDRTFSVVVLPAPFGPRNPTRSPRSIVNVTPSTAFTTSYLRCNSDFIADMKPGGRLCTRKCFTRSRARITASRRYYVSRDLARAWPSPARRPS